MYVVPVPFNEYGKELLGRFQQFVSKGWFTISPVEHKELVTQMRMARFRDNGNLDKDETSGNTFDAFWWAIETITTVAYGEYYPVTFLGRLIGGVLMFAAIGILWTVVALITSKLVERRLKQAGTGIIQDTKDMIKEKIDSIERLDSKELEDLVRLIRTLNQSG